MKRLPTLSAVLLILALVAKANAKPCKPDIEATLYKQLSDGLGPSFTFEAPFRHTSISLDYDFPSTDWIFLGGSVAVTSRVTSDTIMLECDKAGTRLSKLSSLNGTMIESRVNGTLVGYCFPKAWMNGVYQDDTAVEATYGFVLDLNINHEEGRPLDSESDSFQFNRVNDTFRMKLSTMKKEDTDGSQCKAPFDGLKQALEDAIRGRFSDVIARIFQTCSKEWTSERVLGSLQDALGTSVKVNPIQPRIPMQEGMYFEASGTATMSFARLVASDLMFTCSETDKLFTIRTPIGGIAMQIKQGKVSGRCEKGTTMKTKKWTWQLKRESFDATYKFQVAVRINDEESVIVNFPRDFLLFDSYNDCNYQTRQCPEAITTKVANDFLAVIKSAKDVSLITGGSSDTKVLASLTADIMPANLHIYCNQKNRLRQIRVKKPIKFSAKTKLPKEMCPSATTETDFDYEAIYSAKTLISVAEDRTKDIAVTTELEEYKQAKPLDCFEKLGASMKESLSNFLAGKVQDFDLVRDWGDCDGDLVSEVQKQFDDNRQGDFSSNREKGTYKIISNARDVLIIGCELEDSGKIRRIKTKPGQQVTAKFEGILAACNPTQYYEKSKKVPVKGVFAFYLNFIYKSGPKHSDEVERRWSKLSPGKVLEMEPKDCIDNAEMTVNVLITGQIESMIKAKVIAEHNKKLKNAKAAKKE